jgi:anti-sigma factor RsiW
MKNVMTCAEAEELLGAYALDAIPEDDRLRMTEHLASCPEHRAAVEELRSVAPSLALMVEEREASPELRRRIIDAVQRTPQFAGTPSAAVPPEARPTAPKARPARERPRRWQWQPRIAALAAAAVLLLGLGIGIGRFTTPPASQQLMTWSFSGNSLAPAAQAHLVYFKDQQKAVVEVSGLPALSVGQVYEMWLFQAGKPIDAGVASTSGGLVARLDRDLAQYNQFAITVEPGEQPQPTTSPILVGSLKAA